MEFNKAYDNHKTICVTLLVLIFCCKMLIHNIFVQCTVIAETLVKVLENWSDSFLVFLVLLKL